MRILCRRIEPFMPSPASSLGRCFLCIGWCHLQVYASVLWIRFPNVHLLLPHCSQVTLTKKLLNDYATPLQCLSTAPQISCNASQCHRKSPAHLWNPTPTSHCGSFAQLSSQHIDCSSLPIAHEKPICTLSYTQKTYLYTLLRSRDSLSRTHNCLHLAQATLRNYSPQCALQLQWVCTWNENERKCSSMYRSWLRNDDTRELGLREEENEVASACWREDEGVAWEWGLQLRVAWWHINSTFAPCHFNSRSVSSFQGCILCVQKSMVFL